MFGVLNVFADRSSNWKWQSEERRLIHVY